MNWTLEEVIEFVESCYDRDTILDVLMGYSGYWFPARMILIVGRAWVQLFSTTAFDLPSELPRELRRADVADDAPAINEDCVTGTADEVGLGQLFEQLELGHPLIRTLGVRIGARVAIVLLGAVHDEHVETGALEAAAAAAGRQLEDVIRMAKADELPPPDERIPPYPDREEQERPPGSPATGDGRATQNLEVGFDDAPMSAPRLTMTVPESDSSDEINPNATSFGLPFVEGGAVFPGRAVADSGASDPSETSEASSTREGVAHRSEAIAESEADEENPETIIGSPFVEDKFPGDIDSPEENQLDEDSSDAIDLGEPVPSGVDIQSPTDISAAPNRTQLGGIAASLEAMRHEESEASDGPGTLIGSPKMVGQAKSTQLGGVVGQPEVVEETLERVESEAAVAAASEVFGATDESASSSTPGSWVNSRSDGGIPTAMILKPARKRRSTQSGPAAGAVPGSGKSKAEPSAPAAEKEDPDPGPPPEPRPVPVARPSAHTEPTRNAVNPVDLVSKPSDAPQATGQTSFGSWNRGEEGTRRFDAEGEVDDAWFDYFAEEAENAPPNSEAALNFSLSEPSDDPHTIPPETLERLLDSGPAMVDMQEQFMVLDSRDRERAFEAADRVAELGEKAIEVLDLMFPGRVFLDRYQYGDDLPPVDKHGPVLHALVRLGDLALPVATAHLNDSSNEARFYAVYLLTMLDAEPVIRDLFDRLFDRDQQIRGIASELLLQYQSSPDFSSELRTNIRSELKSSDDVHITVAASMLARLRDVESVAGLIDAMDDSATPRVKLAILNALTEITLHHWSSPYEWRQWWRTGKKQSREDWLVEALDASSSDLRQRAYAEVQRIPTLELNYHPDQPSKLRKRAQTELRSWFDK